MWGNAHHLVEWQSHEKNVGNGYKCADNLSSLVFVFVFFMFFTSKNSYHTQLLQTSYLKTTNPPKYVLFFKAEVVILKNLHLTFF